jgi:hypothetical protein
MADDKAINAQNEKGKNKLKNKKMVRRGKKLKIQYSL